LPLLKVMWPCHVSCGCFLIKGAQIHC
jgi:hypothetical protein